MKEEQPVFACDKVGCKSRCTLAAGEPDVDKALRDRGWTVVGANHYCPAHKTA